MFRLLGVYAQLQRSITPVYQLASAHTELAHAVGRLAPDATGDQLALAAAWIRGRITQLATENPDHFKQLMRTRRRLAAA